MAQMERKMENETTTSILVLVCSFGLPADKGSRFAKRFGVLGSLSSGIGLFRDQVLDMERQQEEFGNPTPKFGPDESHVIVRASAKATKLGSALVRIVPDSRGQGSVCRNWNFMP